MMTRIRQHVSDPCVSGYTTLLLSHICNQIDKTHSLYNRITEYRYFEIPIEINFVFRRNY
jgi:hypothetical protein